ncbi:MAG TPA: ABC transporter permease [Gemmatimonadaceae bacterium]|nr:ABC transporter permease [Gemmatimonadaceae bacterium]
MTTYEYPSGPGRSTSTFPIPQRAGIIVFRQVTRTVIGFFADVGARTYFLRETFRAFSQPRTYMPLIVKQMRNIGVDSVPLAGIVAAFIGAVTAYQTRFQLFPGVDLSTVGWIVRQSIVLELAPLITALVLTGRVGARMTAEIGTMRVTEQIDALETLAYDPVAYLIVPRVIAGTLMLPLLTTLAIAIGIVAGMVMAVAATDVTVSAFTSGLRLTFAEFQVIYALIKATLFGFAISLICSYEGFVTGAGAEGVGASTARAVVVTSVVILFLDALTALYLAPYLQA